MRFSLLLVGLLVCGAACGDSGDSCGLDDVNWSTARSGGLCQVDFFEPEHQAVYCGQNQDGGWDCACGPAVDDPPEFSSPDFCDLEPEARACAAVAACNFSL